MAGERPERRLAAILAADVVGYSRLMGADEEGTLAALTAHLTELIEPAIAEHRGRVVKTTGDGLLAEFASVVDAVRCAVAFQEGMEGRNADTPADRRIEFRIGVNLGDVIIQDDDVYGDGVNVAARLEGLAEPGGTIVSGSVHEQVRTKVDFGFDDLGPQAFKNFAEAVRAFKIVDRVTPTAVTSERLFRLPSIAVLPFDNMSGDPEQEYFSDGISEDLITALSRIRQFRVVARNSTFSYKGQSADVRKAARELGVQYVVDGSVRKAGTRIRLSAQLIEGASGNHIWAKHFDRELEDIFEVQDELTKTIVAAVEPALSRAERERASAIRSEDLNAWETYQRAMRQFHKRTREGFVEAERLFRTAIAIDPESAPAHYGLAETLCYMAILGHVDTPRDHFKQAIDLARRSVEIDPLDADARYTLSSAYHFDRDLHQALSHAETAREMNPCSAKIQYGWASAILKLGLAESSVAKIEAGIDGIGLAIALSPNDPWMGPYHARMAEAHIGLEQYEEAIAWARGALAEPNAIWPMAMYLASSLGHLGRIDEAGEAIQTLLRLNPGFDERRVREAFPFATVEFEDRIFDGLRKAGLPE